jgi:hypothetical protein
MEGKLSPSDPLPMADIVAEIAGGLERVARRPAYRQHSERRHCGGGGRRAGRGERGRQRPRRGALRDQELDAPPSARGPDRPFLGGSRTFGPIGSAAYSGDGLVEAAIGLTSRMRKSASTT